MNKHLNIDKEILVLGNMVRLVKFVERMPACQSFVRYV